MFGVHWSIENNYFGFLITLKDRMNNERLGRNDERIFPNLSQLKVDRCVKPNEFGRVKNTIRHNFSDASEIGYAHVSYIKIENQIDGIHTTFLMGKSRVAPMKQTTMPRLELTALVSSRIGNQLKRELTNQLAN